MSTPNDQPGPFAAPGGGAPGGGQPYGQPASGAGYAAPSYREPAYGQPASGAGYGAPSYGQQPSAVVGPDGSWTGPPLASWGQRVGASLLDLTIVLGILVAVAVVAAVLGAASGGLAQLVAVLGYLAIVGFSVWQVIVVQGRTGQTIGKRTVGIRVLRLQDGQPTGIPLAIGRYAAHVLDGWSLGLGYLWPLWDKKSQTFGDKICSTVVIRT